MIAGGYAIGAVSGGSLNPMSATQFPEASHKDSISFELESAILRV